MLTNAPMDRADHVTTELKIHESSSTIYCEVLNFKQLMSMLCQQLVLEASMGNKGDINQNWLFIEIRQFHWNRKEAGILHASSHNQEVNLNP